LNHKITYSQIFGNTGQPGAGGGKPSTSITISFGQNNTRNYVLNHGSSFRKFNYWITGSRRTTDRFELADDFDPNNPKTGFPLMKELYRNLMGGDKSLKP
jgi:hypothetical protein